MSKKIKEIVARYMDVKVIDYDENDDCVLILSDGEKKHEADLLEETISAMRCLINTSIELREFDETKRTMKDLEPILDYYHNNWCA